MQHVDGVTSKEQAIQLCQVSVFFIEELEKAREDQMAAREVGARSAQ